MEDNVAIIQVHRFRHVVGQDVRTSWMAKEKKRGLRVYCAPSVLPSTLSHKRVRMVGEIVWDQGKWCSGWHSGEDGSPLYCVKRVCDVHREAAS